MTNTTQNIDFAYEYKRIASMDLIDFSQHLQDSVKHGYELVFDNENSPVQLGTLLTCGVRRLVYVAKEEEAKEEAEATDVPVVANATLFANTTVSTKQRKTKVTTA